MWKLVTGTQPYSTVFQVHRKSWGKLQQQIGEPLTLEIVDAENRIQKVQGVYILHEIPSDSPNRVSFVVADRRWMWAYTFVSRDYNIPKKSGDRTTLYDHVPVELDITVDVYDFKEFSLDTDHKWTAKRVIENLLDAVMVVDGGDGGDTWFEESWPLDEGGEFSIQNLVIRDQGDVAIARALAFVPGATVYVDTGGMTRVIDGTDFKAAKTYGDKVLKKSPATWAGDHGVHVDRSAIRPSKVNVHFTREVEAVFSFKDDYDDNTAVQFNREDPYLENVLPTVDPITNLKIRSVVGPGGGGGSEFKIHRVPAGTWVSVDLWLEAMEDPENGKPEGCLPWTFDTIRRHWLKGDLEGVLGGDNKRGTAGEDDFANIMLRVQALRQHFRQTFRINPAYMERIRDLKATRVGGAADPVTGQRAFALVMGQWCVIPTVKGERIASRKHPDKQGQWRNISTVPDPDAVDPLTGGEKSENMATQPAGPAKITFIDRDNGVFRVSWETSPYGTVQSIVPCNVVNSAGEDHVPDRSLSMQEQRAMGAGIIMTGHINALFLKDQMELKVLLTIVPAAPNNKNQYHVEEIEAEDISALFRTEFRLQDGDGPELDLFVSPSETTAMFAWDPDLTRDMTDDDPERTVKEMLGLLGDLDINDAGLLKGTRELRGFTWINEKRAVVPYAKSLAAEAIAPFADSFMGRIAGRMPDGYGMQLKGNMSGATIMVGGAPSSKTMVVHEFPGTRKTISRAAMLPDEARQWILGIVPFKSEI